ncbi:uncharacterized protein LOC116202795 [Punica granatum]|uniref:Uncharacterized protein LOC116202795 n=2 Tax=Punica granatum TaxID=22663 RepID=A0A6P8CZP0_PUNGR|nr:uncharacterized protein LOC116202795 [Punica granatum]XP_031390268.1 uncharacterized protein LOC116202795 [Punica granatum]XP_031390269.1 uncharacterized protein LOC116202795 [Punica granatum]PKI68424.1 hypothetical protein CRG98_011221 [Punica granatum]
MGDHFVLPMNRLITDSTIEAALQSENRMQQAADSASTPNALPAISPVNVDIDLCSSPGKLVQCRICHEEDEDSNMEMPCTCRGSLKYAHRKCVQRWCTEKGDTTCEICRQQFRPNYVAPPPLLHYGGISMNGTFFRGNWEIPRRDLNNMRFIAMVAADNEFSDTDFEDFSAPSPRGLICCRIIAIIFMVLLILRHTLPILISVGDYSLTLFALLMLRTVGILLPIFVMVRVYSTIQRRRRQQAAHVSLATADEENELSLPQTQA